MCIDHHVCVASFFFSRRDKTRNSSASLVATLVYQIITRMPDMKGAIIKVIESNPLIFDQAFDTQVSDLITKPLAALHSSATEMMPTVVLIIDALDECVGSPEDQVNIIRAFTKYIAAGKAPIIVLFGSHAQSHLSAVFRAPPVVNMLFDLPLEESTDPSVTRGRIGKGIYSWLIPFSSGSTQPSASRQYFQGCNEAITSAEEAAQMIGANMSMLRSIYF